MMHRSCWCADPADATILLMRWSCWSALSCWCTDTDIALVLLMYGCCWCADANDTESGSGLAHGPFYSNLLLFLNFSQFFSNRTAVIFFEQTKSGKSKPCQMDPTLLDIVLRQSPSLRAAWLQEEIGWISITIVPWSAARICMAMIIVVMVGTTWSVVQLSPSWGFAHQCACNFYSSFGFKQILGLAALTRQMNS